MHALPIQVVAIACDFLDPYDKYALATLFSLRTIQAASFRSMHRFEFDAASRLGDVQLLDLLLWFCRLRAVQPRYTEEGLLLACYFGHVDVLEWWKASGLELKYSDDAMDCASVGCHVRVLQWWKDSGLPLKYSTFAVDYASENDDTAVFLWWKESGLQLKYSEFPKIRKLLGL